MGTGAPRNKLLGLELLRFLAALAVLIWHYQHLSYIGSEPTVVDMERQPLYALFPLLYEYGFFGVHLFWCISGFIFFWKYREAVAGKTVSARDFFVLRFSRLYPLHFATLLIVALLQAVYFSNKGDYFVYPNNDLKHFVLQLFMASNWGFEERLSFNGPIWSISIEVLVYIFFFLVLRNFSKSVFVNLAVLLLCGIVKFTRGQSLITDCFAFFYIGGLAAIALRFFEHTKYRSPIDKLATSLVVIAPLLSYALQLHRFHHFAFAFLVMYIPLLVYVFARNFAVHPIAQKAIEAAGNMTYSSYLIHFPIQLLIALHFATTGQSIPYYSTWLLLSYVIVTLMAAYFIYRFFELPAQTVIRKRFR